MCASAACDIGIYKDMDLPSAHEGPRGDRLKGWAVDSHVPEWAQWRNERGTWDINHTLTPAPRLQPHHRSKDRGTRVIISASAAHSSLEKKSEVG